MPSPRLLGSLLLALIPLHAQQFEVASVKQSPRLSTGDRFFLGPPAGGPGTSDPTHILASKVTLKSILLLAYGVKAFQVVTPDWFDTIWYDFAISVPEGSTKAQVAVMWQTLLADRFMLVVHHESREFPVDELVIVRGGHRLQETTATELDEQAPRKFDAKGRLASIGMLTMVRSVPGGVSGELVAIAQGTAALASLLSNELDHPVVDKTGLTGKYDFAFEFTPKIPATLILRPQTPTAQSLSAADPPLSLAAAVQQNLGLRLEKGKGALDVIVVDKAEQVPTEN